MSGEFWTDEKLVPGEWRFIATRSVKNNTGRELKAGELVHVQYLKDDNGNFVWSAIEPSKPEPKHETWRDRDPLF